MSKDDMTKVEFEKEFKLIDVAYSQGRNSNNGYTWALLCLSIKVGLAILGKLEASE